MQRQQTRRIFAAALCGLLWGAGAQAAVSPEEAAKLKGELTPFGAEKAGNKDGTIPAWTGGYTTPIPGFVNGGKRGDPFANEKPLYTVTAKNMAQYADKLTDGLQSMLKKYPESFRLDVYPTHRTAAGPQWVYDNTAKNAVQAKLENGVLTGAFGGVPFPIPQSGEEVMWNHRLRWRGGAYQAVFSAMQLTGEGKAILMVLAESEVAVPYYDKNGSAEDFNAKGAFWAIRMRNLGPPLRAGEGIAGWEALNDDKTQAWVYLTGQRRTRKMPNACCDTPTPASGGVAGFDQIDVFQGRLDRFNWKILGKKEMLVPYNENRQMQFSMKDLLMPHHLNPEACRYELHRVWMVEATLKPGQRHVQPKRRYYVDEDTWTALLADHWDANGQLWQTSFNSVSVMPDLPATASLGNSGFYDLLSGAAFFATLVNDQAMQIKFVSGFPATLFTPEGLAGDGVR